MKRISLIQIGFGTVGGALIEQVLDNQQRWRDQFGIDVTYGAIAGRDGAVVEPNPDGCKRRASEARLRGGVPACGKARQRSRIRTRSSRWRMSSPGCATAVR